MVLDYRSIDERAAKISSDANLARPLTADATELNTALPERFFDLQDQLKARAAALSAAAARNDALAVADAYGKLSETCVSCHASYRPGGPRAARCAARRDGRSPPPGRPSSPARRVPPWAASGRRSPPPRHHPAPPAITPSTGR
jgi:hypothetical protein